MKATWNLGLHGDLARTQPGYFQITYPVYLIVMCQTKKDSEFILDAFSFYS